MIYQSLRPDTRTLVDLYDEAALRYGLARDDAALSALELAREELLEALRSDFIAAMMDSDSAV